MAHKTENIYYVVLYRNSLPMPVLRKIALLVPWRMNWRVLCKTRGKETSWVPPAGSQERDDDDRS